jgi:hypothetical protein
MVTPRSIAWAKRESIGILDVFSILASLFCWLRIGRTLGKGWLLVNERAALFLLRQPLQKVRPSGRA